MEFKEKFNLVLSANLLVDRVNKLDQKYTFFFIKFTKVKLLKSKIHVFPFDMVSPFTNYGPLIMASL